MNFLKHILLSASLLLPTALMGAAASETPSTFEFPRPTGQYAIGTKVIELTDASRQDPETGNARELVIQIWYPADGKPGKATTPYAYEALKSFTIGMESEMAKLLMQHSNVCTHAIPGAMPLINEETQYPFIIFGHGYGVSRGLYSFLCEEIASHGYIVAMVMHTYVTQVTRFADRREIVVDVESMRKKGPALLETCFTDIEFMLNQASSGAFGGITPICNFNNIGIIGHSLGGIMASQVCKCDARVKAGISLDGPLYKPNAMVPLHKPFMFMIAPTFYDGYDYEENLAIIGMTKSEFDQSFAQSIETFCQKNAAPSYKILLKDAEHSTFTDATVLTRFAKEIFNTKDIDLCAGTIDGIKATHIIRSYVVGFFDTHLKGELSPLLDGRDKQYAADVDFNSWL